MTGRANPAVSNVQYLYIHSYSHKSHPILVILYLILICKESSTVSNQRKFPGTMASWPIGRSDAENEPPAPGIWWTTSIHPCCLFSSFSFHYPQPLLHPLTLPLTLILPQDVRASGIQVRSAFQAGKESFFSRSLVCLFNPVVLGTIPDEDLGNRAEHHHRACANTLRRPPRASL